MLPERNMNPMAPPYLNGCNPCDADGFVDVAHDLPFSVILEANQVLRGQQISIGTDADWALRAIVAYTEQDGGFRLADSRGMYLSDDYIGFFAINAQFTFSPYPIFPEMVFPAGSRMLIDLTNAVATTNRVQLVFRGVSRYRAN